LFAALRRYPMTHATTQIALHRPLPRELRKIDRLAAAWRGAGAAIWRALQAVGHRRAEREIGLLLQQWDVSQPELAKQLREALRRGD
jgi:hypothetical protein